MNLFCDIYEIEVEFLPFIYWHKNCLNSVVNQNDNIMKNLKMYFVATCILLGGTSFLSAQDQSPKPQQPIQKKQMAKKRKAVIKDLDLTDEQRLKMKEIKRVYHSKIMEVKDVEGVSEESKKQKIWELKKEEHIEMNNVLSDVQKQKIKERRAKSKLTPAQRSEAYINRLDAIVSLSTEQKEKLKKTLEDFNKERSVLEANKELSKTEKDNQRKELWKKQRSAIKELLSDEQRELMKQHRADRNSHKKESSTKKELKSK